MYFNFKKMYFKTNAQNHVLQDNNGGKIIKKIESWLTVKIMSCKTKMVRKKSMKEMIFRWDKTDAQNHALKDFNIKKNQSSQKISLMKN